MASEALIKRRRMPYKTGFSLETARKMLDAGVAEADKQGMPTAMAIVDIGGNLKAFFRMDECVLFASQIAQDKAYTAVFGKEQTGVWSNNYKSGFLVPLFFHERWISFIGGFPLIKNGAVFGGIGVSGATSEDLYVTRAAIAAGGFDMTEINEVIASIEKPAK